jgi:hypothetical protein
MYLISDISIVRGSALSVQGYWLLDVLEKTVGARNDSAPV